MKNAMRETTRRNNRKPRMCHLYLPQIIWRRALSGDVNHGNEVGGRFGSSNGGFLFGSSRPSPAGLASASALFIISKVISSLPVLFIDPVFIELVAHQP